MWAYDGGNDRVNGEGRGSIRVRQIANHSLAELFVELAECGCFNDRRRPGGAGELLDRFNGAMHFELFAAEEVVQHPRALVVELLLGGLEQMLFAKIVRPQHAEPDTDFRGLLSEPPDALSGLFICEELCRSLLGEETQGVQRNIWNHAKPNVAMNVLRLCGRKSGAGEKLGRRLAACRVPVMKLADDESFSVRALNGAWAREHCRAFDDGSDNLLAGNVFEKFQSCFGGQRKSREGLFLQMKEPGRNAVRRGDDERLRGDETSNIRRDVDEGFDSHGEKDIAMGAGFFRARGNSKARGRDLLAGEAEMTNSLTFQGLPAFSASDDRHRMATSDELPREIEADGPCTVNAA